MLGGVPRRCRGLAREMHLRCAGAERLVGMVRSDHMAHSHTDAPTHGCAHTRMRPNGAPPRPIPASA